MATLMKDIYLEETEEELLAMSRDEVIEELTEREVSFCQYYTGKWNVKVAAIKAGYAPSSASYVGWRVRNMVKVNRYICWLKVRIAKSCHVNSMDLVDMYARMAFADMNDFAHVVDGKVIPLNSDQTDGQLVTKLKQGRDGVTIELEDRKWAMNKLEIYFDVKPKDWKRNIEERKLKILEERLALDKKKSGEVEEWEDDGFLEALQDSADEIWDDYEDEEDDD